MKMQLERRMKEMEERERRISELEEREKRGERESRRNNIVIKGAKWKETGVQEVKEFLKENLKLDVEVEESWKVRKDKGAETVVMKLREQMSKKQIMTRKKNLKTGVYIDDDLTQKDNIRKIKETGR